MYRNFFSSGIMCLALACFDQATIAQVAPNHIYIDNSLNEGAIQGILRNIQTGQGYVRGDIVVENTTDLWWKVFVDEVPKVLGFKYSPATKEALNRNALIETSHKPNCT